MEFAEKYPRLIDEHGYPATWAAFVYGMQHLGRAAAIEKLRIADAVNAGQGVKDYMTEWQAVQRTLAGYL